jgi:uncharacterized membrane protein
MSTIEHRSPASITDADRNAGRESIDEVADAVDDAVDDNPAIERLTRLGWIAKGVVYTLMGGAAISIAQSTYESRDEEASPKGALDTIIEQPGGRIAIGVLAVGLALYCIWRLLSVAVIRSTDMSAWLDRIGYLFSAGFYAVLTFVAARAAINGADPDRDNTVERWSQRVMDWQFGRWLVMAAGIVTFAVGVFFVVRKGLMRSFCDDLTDVDGDRRDDTIEKILVASGVAGWIGRGIVTMLVGFFVTRAAWRFDPDEARGFDAALRSVADTSTGTVLVWVAGIGLVTYGAFCLISHRRRRLQEDCS